jgi:hypothetical protein
LDASSDAGDAPAALGRTASPPTLRQLHHVSMRGDSGAPSASLLSTMRLQHGGTAETLRARSPSPPKARAGCDGGASPRVSNASSDGVDSSAAFGNVSRSYDALLFAAEQAELEPAVARGASPPPPSPPPSPPPPPPPQQQSPKALQPSPKKAAPLPQPQQSQPPPPAAVPQQRASPKPAAPKPPPPPAAAPPPPAPHEQRQSYPAAPPARARVAAPPPPAAPEPRRRVLPAALLAVSDAADASMVAWDLPPPPSGLALAADDYAEEGEEHAGAAHFASAPPPPPPPPPGADDSFDALYVSSLSAAEGASRSRVDYVPYTQADYSRLVGARAYWQLGRLGPDLETSELTAKRAARARALEFARQAHSTNTVELASRRAAAAPPKAPTARDRATAWAAGTFAPGGGLASLPRTARSASPRRASELSCGDGGGASPTAS